MNPTDSQIAFRLRKLKTAFFRFDVNKDGLISREDFELMAERMNKFGNATAEQAQSCHNSFMLVADFFGYKHGEELQREKAAEDMHQVMLNLPLEERRVICDKFYNSIFDAVDSNRDGQISLEEYKTYTKALAPELSDEYKVESFNLIDADHNGEISREEFLDAAYDFYYAFEENEMTDVFFGPLVA
jgi:Ca2+-binding EF-hand superfamily protein